MWISGVGSNDMNHSWLVVLQIQHSGQMNSMRCFFGGDNEARLRLMSRRYARSAVWSGRWDLNPRQLAWEARTLPLSYARSTTPERNPTMALTSSQGSPLVIRARPS